MPTQWNYRSCSIYANYIVVFCRGSSNAFNGLHLNTLGATVSLGSYSNRRGYQPLFECRAVPIVDGSTISHRRDRGSSLVEFWTVDVKDVPSCSNWTTTTQRSGTGRRWWATGSVWWGPSYLVWLWLWNFRLYIYTYIYTYIYIYIYIYTLCFKPGI